MVAHLLEQAFHEPLTFTPCDMWPLLRGRTLWIIGDSQVGRAEALLASLALQKLQDTLAAQQAAAREAQACQAPKRLTRGCAGQALDLHIAAECFYREFWDLTHLMLPVEPSVASQLAAAGHRGRAGPASLRAAAGADQDLLCARQQGAAQPCRRERLQLSWL